MTKKMYKWLVSGFTRFPIDMLRYDECFPLTESDSGVIAHTLEVSRRTTGPFEVQVGSYSRTPSNERWKSFGWKVKLVLR